jgi:uncharacterized protein (TIGR03435 family)
VTATRATTIVMGLLMAGGTFGQQASLPKFRTISVEPAKTEEQAAGRGKEGNPASISAGLTGAVRIRNATIKDCIAWAYDLPGYLIFDNGQLFSNRYDIDAKTPIGISANRYREMLQSLLADRFDLKVHREVRTTAAYALAVADGGLKLHPGNKIGGRFRAGRETLSGENVSIKDIAGRLAVLLNRPILDATSIEGGVTFSLIWKQSQLKQRSRPPDSASRLNAFMSAVEEQLGLKLVPQDSPTNMLVVDHAQVPTLGIGGLDIWVPQDATTAVYDRWEHERDRMVCYWEH